MFRLVIVSCLIAATLAAQVPNFNTHKNHFYYDKLEQPFADQTNVFISIIDQIREWALETSDRLQSGIAAIIDNVINQLFDIQLRLNDALDELFGELVSAIDESRLIGSCFHEYLAALRLIKADAAKELTVCVQNGVNQVQDLLVAMQIHFAPIKDEVDAIQDVIELCTGAPHTVFLCYVKNIRQIISSVEAIVQNAIVAWTHAEPGLAVILFDVHTCGSNVVNQARESARQAGIEVHECVASNNQTTTSQPNAVLMQ